MYVCVCVCVCACVCECLNIIVYVPVHGVLQRKSVSHSQRRFVVQMLCEWGSGHTITTPATGKTREVGTHNPGEAGDGELAEPPVATIIRSVFNGQQAGLS
jgi:hypothetical protein